ncbi:MAG: glycosyltransferase family 4 protein [Alphaproteobacteria bacterium]
MMKQLKIAVLKDRYPTLFNTPRISRHTIKRVPFIPTHKISHHIEGFTLPLAFGADLGHYVNRIPVVSRIPFIMSFESHLPRYFAGEHTKLFRLMRQQLTNPLCRQIIAMSKFAKNLFIRQHENSHAFDDLMKKIQIIYPHIHLPIYDAHKKRTPGPLKLVFIGSHFGRKGGAVTVRAAEIAKARNLPVRFHIISSLQAGHGIWTDPHSEDFFNPYFKLLNLDNITFDRHLPNVRIFDVLKESDFSILTTFSDTFGYSAIESLSTGTPVIATPQGALPEFVQHEQNGLMIPLATDPFGEWQHIKRNDNGSAAYAAMFKAEIDRMAEDLIKAISPYIDNPEKITPMRANARNTAESMFDTQKTSVYLDALYDQSV